MLLDNNSFFFLLQSFLSFPFFFFFFFFVNMRVTGELILLKAPGEGTLYHEEKLCVRHAFRRFVYILIDAKKDNF